MTDSEDYFTKMKIIDGNILKKAMDDRTDLLKLLDFFKITTQSERDNGYLQPILGKTLVEDKDVIIMKINTVLNCPNKYSVIDSDILTKLINACDKYKKINSLRIYPRMYGMFKDDEYNLYIVIENVKKIYSDVIRGSDRLSVTFSKEIQKKMLFLLNETIYENDLKIELRLDSLIIYNYESESSFSIMLKYHEFEDTLREQCNHTETMGYVRASYVVPYERIPGSTTSYRTTNLSSSNMVLDYLLHNVYIIGLITIYHLRIGYDFEIENCFDRYVTYKRQRKDVETFQTWRNVRDDDMTVSIGSLLYLKKYLIPSAVHEDKHKPFLDQIIKVLDPNPYNRYNTNKWSRRRHLMMAISLFLKGEVTEASIQRIFDIHGLIRLIISFL